MKLRTDHLAFLPTLPFLSLFVSTSLFSQSSWNCSQSYSKRAQLFPCSTWEWSLPESRSVFFILVIGWIDPSTPLLLVWWLVLLSLTQSILVPIPLSYKGTIVTASSSNQMGVWAGDCLYAERLCCDCDQCSHITSNIEYLLPQSSPQ